MTAPDRAWATYQAHFDALGSRDSETFFRAMSDYRARVVPTYRLKTWSGTRSVVEASLGEGSLDEAVEFAEARVRGEAVPVPTVKPLAAAKPLAAVESPPPHDDLQDFFSGLGVPASAEETTPEPESAPEPPPPPTPSLLDLIAQHEMPEIVRAHFEEMLRRGMIGEPLPVEPFRDYVARVQPGYRFYKHCEVMIAVLQRIADGEIKRAMFFAPPRSGKSQLLSRLFPAYYLGRFPDRFYGLCSYGAALANDLSRAARDYYQRGGAPFREDATAIANWLTARGGGMWSAGVGGAITGKGFSCLHPETMIQCPSGDKTIREIVEARRPVPVYSFNHASNRVEIRTAHPFPVRYTSEPIVRIRVGRRTLEATPEHPVYVVGKGYIPAIEVKPGDRVQCRHFGIMFASIAALRIFVSKRINFVRRGDFALGRAILSIARTIGRLFAASNAEPTSSRLRRMSGDASTTSARRPVLALGREGLTTPTGRALAPARRAANP